MADIDLNEALKEAVTGQAAEVNTEATEPAAAEEETNTETGAEDGAAEPVETEPAEGFEADGETKEDETEPVATAYTPDDATVERAVKAGLSLADAKALPNAEMTERIIAALEAKAPSETTPEEPKAADDDDLSVVAAEFTEDNGYEPNMVKLVQNLVKRIGTLEAAGASAAKASFFDSQFSGLDSSVRSHVDAVRKSQLKSKFDMLEAGYKATKADVKREDVFKEAVNLALGDLVQKASEERKTSKLTQRKTLALARPGGESGARRSADRPMTGDEIVDELFAALNR